MSRRDFLRGHDEGSADGSLEVDSSFDNVLTLLSNHKRRAVIYVLADADQEELFVVDLAQKVALLDDTADDLETVLTELRHAHLPHIAAAGFVDYDEHTNMVRYTATDELEELLNYTKDIDFSD